MDFILNLKELLLLFAAFLSFLLAFSFFLRSKPVNKIATKFLITFLFIIFLRLVLRLIDDTRQFEEYFFIFEFNRVLGLLTPSLFYLYVNYFLNDLREFKRSTMLHFAIPLVLLFYYISFLFEGSSSYYNRPSFALWYSSFAFIYSLYYLIGSINIYRSFRNSISGRDVLKQSKHIKVLEWVRLLLIIYSTFLVFAILAVFIDSDTVRDLPFQILSILIPLVCIKLFNMANLISLDPVPKKKYGGKKLKESVSNILLSKLDEVVIEKQLFKNPDITISQVAEELNISEDEISRFLNDERGLSFNKFINKKRVAYAKELLSDSALTKKLTIEHLGYQAGFNSKTTFFNSFKLDEGITPGAFKKKQSSSKN